MAGEWLLVVDDEAAVRFALQEYFISAGYTVDGVRSLAQAEAMLEAHDYSLILADVQLGGSENRDGLEVARRARQRVPNVRIVILTAYGSKEAEAEAKRLGVDAFLHKPQPLRDLELVVELLLGT